MSWSLGAGAYTGVYFGYINVNQPVVLKFFCGSGQLARLTHVATLTLTCLIYPSFLTPPLILFAARALGEASFGEIEPCHMHCRARRHRHSDHMHVGSPPAPVLFIPPSRRDWGRESWDAFHVLGRGRPETHTLVIQQEHPGRLLPPFHFPLSRWW